MFFSLQFIFSWRNFLVFIIWTGFLIFLVIRLIFCFSGQDLFLFDLVITFTNFIVKLPVSKTLSYYWNFGSFLGIILMFQLLTGVFLTFFFTNHFTFAFDSIQYIINEVSLGWFFRLCHFNGARFLFLLIYLHFFKALFIGGYRLFWVWLVGLFLFLLFMAESLLGYVLVWSQMSFWAAVVITSLLSIVPYFGYNLIYWLGGGFFG